MAKDGAGVSRYIRAGDLAIIVACAKMWCFRPIKFLIGIGYVVVITEGLRMVVPVLGMKLYRLPFLGSLKNFEVWHELDLAPFAAILLFVCSSTIWCALIEAWLFDDLAPQTTGRHLKRYQQCMAALGGIILFADACLFYRAMTMAGWGAKAFSLTSLLCTLTYLAVLVSVCVVSVNLKRHYISLKGGRRPHGVAS